MRDHNGPEASTPGDPSAPRARFDGLVVTESAAEVLVYDTAAHHIHHLNQVSAAIWRLCDGRKSIAGLARDSGLDREMVRLALVKLDEANLLDGTLDPGLRLKGASRRSFMKRVAAATAVPAIVSISAPTAAMASSHCVNEGGAPAGTACNRHAQCCSGECGGQPYMNGPGLCT